MSFDINKLRTILDELDQEAESLKQDNINLAEFHESIKITKNKKMTGSGDDHDDLIGMGNQVDIQFSDEMNLEMNKILNLAKNIENNGGVRNKKEFRKIIEEK